LILNIERAWELGHEKTVYHLERATDGSWVFTSKANKLFQSVYIVPKVPWRENFPVFLGNETSFPRINGKYPLQRTSNPILPDGSDMNGGGDDGNGILYDGGVRRRSVVLTVCQQFGFALSLPGSFGRWRDGWRWLS
jgi:hypothetical protein